MMQQRRRPIHCQVTPPSPKRRYGGSVVSLAAHLILIALLLFTIDHDFASAVDRGATISPFHGGGGGGGGGVQFVALPETPRPAPAAAKPVEKAVEPTPLPIVTKTPETIPPPVETKPAEPAAAVATTPAASPGDGGAGTGGGTGGGAGPGNGPGNGAGNGPGNGTGTEGLGTRAKQRVLVPILDSPPKSLRGQTVNYTFWVGPDGKVQKVELHPEIQDKGFREKVLRALRDWQFTPARDGHGVMVPDTLTVEYRF